MIRRHSPSAIFMHWFNAVCWFFLLGSGLALLRNPAMQPVGQWWVHLWAGSFGEETLLFLHLATGCVWLAVYTLYVLLRARADVLPFLREIIRISPVADAVWCVRKGCCLVLGPAVMKKLGLNPDLPPQGFYNAGQKLVAVVAVLGSLGLAVTGLWLTALVLRLMPDPATVTVYTQWVMAGHFACAAVVAVFLPVHIYMAAFAPGEGPALRSMLSGMISVNFVYHHNPLWYKELVKSGKIPNASRSTPYSNTSH